MALSFAKYYTRSIHIRSVLAMQINTSTNLIDFEKFFVHGRVLCWLEWAAKLHLPADDVHQLQVVSTVTTAQGASRYNHVEVKVRGTDQ